MDAVRTRDERAVKASQGQKEIQSRDSMGKPHVPTISPLPPQRLQSINLASKKASISSNSYGTALGRWRSNS